jgi:hypothetical protein
MSPHKTNLCPDFFFYANLLQSFPESLYSHSTLLPTISKPFCTLRICLTHFLTDIFIRILNLFCYRFPLPVSPRNKLVEW